MNTAIFDRWEGLNILDPNSAIPALTRQDKQLIAYFKTDQVTTRMISLSLIRWAFCPNLRLGYFREVFPDWSFGRWPKAFLKRVRFC